MSTILLKKSWLYSTKKAKRSLNKKYVRLNKFATQLNENLPPSEQWFHNLFNKENLNLSTLSNYPFSGYIVDVIDLNMKFIIEIDGASHNNFNQKQKDEYRDFKLNQKGFIVIRIIAYNMDSYYSALSTIKQLIKDRPDQYTESVNRKKTFKSKVIKKQIYCSLCGSVVQNKKSKTCNECIIKHNESHGY